MNHFNAHKMSGAQDKKMEMTYNNLVDLLNRVIRKIIIDTTDANGLTLNNDGETLSISLADTDTTGALSYTDWNTFNNKQNHSNELDALSSLADTAGFIKKTGDATYSIDTTNYQPLDDDLSAIAALTGSIGLLKKTAENTWIIDTSTYTTDSNAIAYAIALG
jgi:hypothetical protein